MAQPQAADEIAGELTVRAAVLGPRDQWALMPDPEQLIDEATGFRAEVSGSGRPGRRLPRATATGGPGALTGDGPFNDQTAATSVVASQSGGQPGWPVVGEARTRA